MRKPNRRNSRRNLKPNTMAKGNGGWPSTTGNKSGGGRNNGPRK